MRLRQNKLASMLLSEGQAVHKTAHGESMLPTITDGAVVLIKPVDIDQIKRGDVVYLAPSSEKAIIHRVFRFRTIKGIRLVQTWGDNNLAPDPFVRCDKIMGRVVSMEKQGHWIVLKRGIFSLFISMLKGNKHIVFLFKRLVQKISKPLS